MSNLRKNCVLSAATGWLLLVLPVMAVDGVKGNLVTTGWLETHLKDGNLLILDASPPQVHTSNHIAGAINVDAFPYGVREIPVADMEKLYQNWGISPGKIIVIYDQGGSMMATRVFYSLYYHGYPTKDVFILDGGLAKWQEQKLPVTKEVTAAPKPGSFRIHRVNEDARARLPEMLTASGDPLRNALVEALGANWHFGEVQVFNRAGHIPYGILAASTDFYNPDKTFKSADDIREMMAYLSIRPDQQVYSYCGGGVAATVPFFALKFILNYPSVKLYPESEMGWLADDRELPYWTYDAPYLVRDTNWLQFWGGQMIRTVGGVRVSIVDVRPAAAFNSGHLPFALNVPADVFRTNIGDPGKLAGILGPAGIDASHEAVVVSGAGLTKDAALAFLELQKLGQKDVSIFMESLDKWVQHGFALSKDATLVGAKKSSQDLSIPPTIYPANFRKDVIIADPQSTRGVYPKVFLASGKDVPAKTPDGKVVHVPYTDLLNGDGTPKAAKDIWNTLTKAGVPRYAELICFSDDLGEAAVNYFVLKLMGYPDIKVLLPS